MHGYHSNLIVLFMQRLVHYLTYKCMDVYVTYKCMDVYVTYKCMDVYVAV